MAENLLEAGPPSAKRPKMTAPASDGPGNSNTTQKANFTLGFSPLTRTILHTKRV